MEKGFFELKEDIYFPKTREYFEEVEKSFYNENYRSAIVMLYSVVIADLLYKLEELKDYYSDPVADEILRDINKIRESNPKNSDWENQLIDRIKKDTKIIEPYVLTNIEDLKNVRNFSAHPSLDQNNELIRPTREKTLGLIKEMITGIFVRPPLFIKKITENLTEDIASKKEDFVVDKEKFKKYIEKKYLERIPENMIIGIFRDFWKLTFKLENENCSKNREINFLLLIVIMQKYRLKIIEDMKKENGKYNNISDKDEIINYLIEFIYYYPETFNYLKDENKITIEVSINKNDAYKTIAFFSSPSIEEHIKILKLSNLRNEHTRVLLEDKVRQEGLEYLLLDQYIEIFGNSQSYDSSDSMFETLIFPNLGKMQKSQIEKLIEKINSNNQIYNRGKSRFDNNRIIEKSNNIDWYGMDLKKYSNFEYDERAIDDKMLPF